MEKGSYVRLPLVFTTTLVALLIFNSGHGLVFSGFCYAQGIDQVKERIFKEASEALQKAEAEDVISLSPGNFAKANELYQRALQDYEAGEGSEKIRRNLDRAMEYINTAFEKARFSRTVLEDLIQTRKEAKAVEIPERAEYIFSKAESMFSEAAMKIEDGDLEGAKSIAKDAEREYRATVIEGLRKFVLADARKKLKDMGRAAPEEPYRKAEAELDKTEALIRAQEPTEFAIAELIDEVDTRVQQALTFASVKPPDLITERLSLSPELPHAGQEVVIRASVRNIGDQPAEAIVVVFLTQGRREIGRATIQHLEPTQTEAANITAMVPELDQYLIIVRIDPENLIAESNKRNNEVQQSFAVQLSPTGEVIEGAGVWRYIVLCIVAFALGSAATFFAVKPRKKVKESVTTPEENLRIHDRVIDRKAELGIEDFKINGRVLQPDSTPVSGAVVRVFDKYLRSEVLLGETTTNEEGRYEVEYAAEEFLKTKKQQQNLVVRAFDQEDQEIALSEIIYDPEKAETVDLILGAQEYRRSSEYQELMDKLTSRLQGAKVTDLTKQDVIMLFDLLVLERQKRLLD